MIFLRDLLLSHCTWLFIVAQSKEKNPKSGSGIGEFRSFLTRDQMCWLTQVGL